VKEMWIPDSLERIPVGWGSLDGTEAPLEIRNSMTAPLLRRDDASIWSEDTAKALLRPQQARDVSPMTRQSIEGHTSYLDRVSFDDRGEAIGLSRWPNAVSPKRPLSDEYSPMGSGASK